jgi:hypothetical protein
MPPKEIEDGVTRSGARAASYARQSQPKTLHHPRANSLYDIGAVRRCHVLSMAGLHCGNKVF